MYFGGRKDVEDAEYKSLLTPPKEGVTKPSDVRNGDLVSLLLAATPPYLYNMPLVPQTFFFSEMLRSFVQAKAERQNSKSHHVHRRRKRAWRESSPKPCQETEKPLELTTPRAPEKSPSPPIKRAAPSCDFTAEKLANSSVTPDGSADVPPLPAPPMWYPNMYNQPPYPIDPLHFFIDLRVSAHIWDRKLSGERNNNGDDVQEISPLNLASHRGDTAAKVDLHKCRQNSAFSVPDRRENDTGRVYERSKNSVHYFMSNLKEVFAKKNENKDDAKESKTCEDKENGNRDLRETIGMELVSDYVKKESDEESQSEDEDDLPEGKFEDKFSK